MFVLKSTYDKLKVEHDKADRAVYFFSRKLAELQERFNRLMMITEQYKALSKQSGLSTDDIRKLIALCHPDKHGGKKIATDMTTKLLSMRGR